MSYSVRSLTPFCASSILLESTEYPQCSTIPGERFVVEDFLVSTGRAKILNVKVDGGRMTVYKRGNHEEVTGVAAHPQLPHIAVCSLTGQLKIYDYEQKYVCVTFRKSPNSNELYLIDVKG
ncbi:unnamed protein product [Dicrocoelium dendriticum]|nr:unnamed protein product [Dicrocoelium dendriticum]